MLHFSPTFQPLTLFSIHVLQFLFSFSARGDWFYSVINLFQSNPVISLSHTTRSFRKDILGIKERYNEATNILEQTMNNQTFYYHLKVWLVSVFVDSYQLFMVHSVFKFAIVANFWFTTQTSS